MKELLISVTNFFRDPNAFSVLEQRIIPQLFERKRNGDQVRVWSAGCATGEEAYSLAMMLSEFATNLADAPSIQVFATDLDEHAIATARDGLYSEVDVADVSSDRLARFFQREAGGYRVRRELRQRVLFAHHNVIKDPPFAHLDLISCRNLLIYLNRPIQERLIETFHFALRPGGYLLLGTAEAADAAADMFMLVDKNSHLFESRAVMTRPSLTLAERSVPLTPSQRAPEPWSQQERTSPGELHLRLLEQYAPPSVVVNEEYTLLHVSERAGKFLQMPGGEPSRDILKLIHPDLRADLFTALHLAGQERQSVEIQGVHVRRPDGERLVRIAVKPVLREDHPPRGYFLVQFQDDLTSLTAGSDSTSVQLTSPAEPEARRLAEELSRLKAQLDGTIKQYETHSEEARAANEELQAMNEELRSAAEELETSKEELQSVNEELTTVNQELKIKIEELGLTNNDFQNLINSTDIGTIFLDRSLRVKLSTPRARDVFNLLPTDTGRQLSDITTRVMHESLHDDMVHVLENLQTIEREVQTRDGRWYLMRIHPYRTIDDRIDGVVLTFPDITLRRSAQEQVRTGAEHLRLLVESLTDYAIFTLTSSGTVESWNSGAERMFGYTAEQIIGQDADILFTPEDRDAGVPQEELEHARVHGRAADERWHQRKDGTRFYCSGVMTRITGGDSFAKIARDLTEKRQSEMALEQARNKLEDRVRQRTSELQAEVERGNQASAHISSLLQRVVTAQEDERARIARDLHDQLGQQLTALRLSLEQHLESSSPGAHPHLHKALQLTQVIDREVDFLAWELRPASLDDLGLAAALPRFVREWSAHHGIAANFHGPASLDGQLTGAAETAFYRVAQEALNNVGKHAHASRVDVLLEKSDRIVTLVIEDDGVGFDQTTRQFGNGIGLASMRERAGLIGAALEIESAPERGTTVYLRCPTPGVRGD
jgi:two-component system CheB/CheR fusion protein